MKSFRVFPLSGRKYYGTEIVDENDVCVIEIWGVNSLRKPSTRELAIWNSEEPYEICDQHYEDEGDLEVANVIVKALNEYFRDQE